MKKGIPLRVVLAGCFVCFCIFIIGYERHSLQLQQHELEGFARIIASSVRNPDSRYYKEYLERTAQHTGYKNLAVTVDEGKILYAASTELSGVADIILEKLGLIRKVALQAPIVFNGQHVGRITAVWFNKAIYSYLNFFALGMLLFIILGLYSRILRTNESLEEKVAEQIGAPEAANRVLQESREPYGEFIEKANSIIVCRKTDGAITFMNDFGLKFFGYAAQEITGRNVVGTIVPETESSGRSLAAMIDDIARHPQKYINNENENICKNGRRVWIAWTNRAVYDASGNISEILSIGTDVTDRRLAEEKLKRSESLLREAQQMSHTGSWTTDLQKNETYWSDEFFRLLGYEPGEVPPSFDRFIEHIHPDELQKLMDRNTRDPSDPASYSPQEFRIIRRGGELRHTIVNSSMHMDDHGHLVQVSGFVQDITALKQGEEALRESQERFARMAESIEEGLTIVEQGKIVYANDRVCDIFGISKDFYLSGAFDPSFIAPPEEKERLEAIRQEYLKKKRMSESIAFWIELADGERRYIQSRYVYRTWDADASHCYIVTTDATARKRAEDALRQSIEQLRGREQELEAVNAQLKAQEQQLTRVNMELQSSNQQLKASRTELEHAVAFLENIYQTSIEGLITTDDKGYIIRANRAALKILGCTAEAEVVGRHMAELCPQEEPYIGIAVRVMTEMREKGFIHDLSTSLVRQDGSRCPVEFNGAYLLNDTGERIGSIVCIRDITERQRAEETLRESEERFRALAETSPDAIFTTDKDMNIVFWNAAAERIFGYTRQEILGRPAEPLIPKNRMIIHQEDRKMVLETSQSPAYESAVESTALRKDGTEFPVEVSLTSWRLHDQIFFSMILRDITERKQAENEIRASNEFLKTMLKASPDIIIASDARGVITMISDNADEVFSYTAEELLGQSAALLVPENEDGVQRVYAMIEEFFDTGSIKNYEIRWEKKDGTIAYIEWNGLMLVDKDGARLGSVAVVRDITSRKLLESQIRQAQKMESIGTLAGGIAHDFNNILTAIIGYTEMNLYHAGENVSVRHNSENVLKAAGRARDLVKQILTFSRPGDEERKPVQVKLIISEACKLLRASLPASIDMQLFLVSESYVFAAPTHLHQIIINLCTNAAHALQERGGLLSVSLVDEDIDATDGACLPDLLPGQYLKLTVTDTGAGIAPTIIHRIFDPFFTTKESGKGTGMGLAMVYGIVKSYGGAITVASDVGRGSTFEVYLPRIQGADAGVSLEEPEAPKGTERILFVDDEELIIEAGLALLKTLGYDVVTANEPNRALEIFREHPGDFDLVITDYTMPNMNGFDLAGEIMRLRPGIPVMLCTGFSENMSPEKAQAAGIKAFVMKPLSRLELAQAIRKALDAGSA
jgi:PAS domain S-box-containing protein